MPAMPPPSRYDLDDERGNPQFPGEMPTPVGEICGSCGEPIQEGDQGSMIPHLDMEGTTIKPQHVECLLRDVLGGIEHLTAPPGHPVGTCYDGSTLTRRQSALAAYAWVREHGVP